MIPTFRRLVLAAILVAALTSGARALDPTTGTWTEVKPAPGSTVVPPHTTDDRLTAP